MPTAIPTMPDSASGVSKQRDSPNVAVSPSVTRNTPPSAPTSSPNTTTRSSSLRASARAELMAWAIVTDAISDLHFFLLGELGAQRGGLLAQLGVGGAVDVGEHLLRR